MESRMPGGGNNNSGWETHKENIQPLSRGRKVSILQHSLDTSRNVVDYEQEMEQQIRNYEEKIASYVGDDPIEPWIEFISFLEQSTLLSAKLKKKLSECVKACIKTFSGVTKYSNDRRYVDLYIQVTKDLDSQRCRALKQFLGKGIGTLTAEMYLAISDLEESDGRFDDALKILQEGLQKQAHPKEKLQEALEGLQFRTAQRLAEKLNQNLEDKKVDSSEVGRHFGASVPVFGSRCEAPVFRNELEPAEPVQRFRPPMFRSGIEVSNIPKKPISILKSHSSDATPLANLGISVENVETPSQSSLNCRSSLADIVIAKPPEDKENKLDPSTWNSKEVAVPKEPFVVPAMMDAPVEKLQLYKEEDPLSSDKNTCNAKNSNLFTGSSSAVFKHPPVSTTYNGSSNSVTSVNIVALKVCEEYGQIEMRKRKLWREREELRLKSIDAQQLERELEKYKIRVNQMEMELRATQSKLSESVRNTTTVQGKLEAQEKGFNELLKLAECEIQRLKTLKEELTQDLKSEDDKIRELHTILSNERYNSQKISDELDEMKKLNAELSARLDEEMKKAASSNSSGPSSTSTLVATTGSVSAASCSGGNGLTADSTNNNSNTNQVSNDEFSFLPNLPASHRGNEVEKQHQRRMPTSSADTFNASVRMGTTYFMKEDTQAAIPLVKYGSGAAAQKLPLKPVENVDLDESSFLPPPPIPKKALTFNLYESVADTHSMSLFAPMSMGPSAVPKPMGPPPALQNPYAKENIPPTSVVPVASRQLGLERRSSMGIVSSVHADISAIEINYDDDAPFVPDPRFNNFDLADLTRNLELNQPLLNSTPERFAPQAANCAMNLNEQRGNFIHTQRFNAIPFADLEIEGPMSPEVLARNTKRSTREEPHCDENGVGNMSRLLLNLSPIQETSKENRSSCTTGSSSGNMTSTRGGSTSSGASLYNSTRSVSGPKSASKHHTYNLNN